MLRTTVASTAITVLCGFCITAVAQDIPGQSFESILEYAESFGSLNTRYYRQVELKAKLIRESNEARTRLAASEQDLAQIQSQSIVQSMRMMESKLLGSLTQLEMNNQLINAPFGKSPSGPAAKALRESTVTAQFITANNLNLNEQAKQLDLASQLTLERRQKILVELQQLTFQAQEWFLAEQKIVGEYVELSDVAGVQSVFQWKAALRELKSADKYNIGAKLAKAITLIRLEREAEATQLLDEIQQLPNFAAAVVLAIRAEIHARNGNRSEANKLLNEAGQFAQTDPRVRWLNAQTLMILDEPKRAGVEWELLLRSGTHEIAAHRGLAFTSCACFVKWPDNERFKKKALENAQLASSLSGEVDWSCQIALALATAVNRDFANAAVIAEKAAQLAVAEKKILCSDIADELKAGVIPSWRF